MNEPEILVLSGMAVLAALGKSVAKETRAIGFIQENSVEKHSGSIACGSSLRGISCSDRRVCSIGNCDTVGFKIETRFDVD